MVVEVRQNSGEDDVADSHAAFARLADASAKLFAEQAAAMAAMTAFSFSVAGQMTSLMLDALRPAEEKAADKRSGHTAMNVASTDGNVVHLRAKSEKNGAAAETGRKAGAAVEVVRPGTEAAKPEPRAKAGPRPAKKAPPGKVATAAEPVSEVSTSKAASGSRSASQAVADDLKKISGIGPRLEKVLNGRGISTYAQIAGLGASALRKIDDELGLEGRVIRDDWAGQAKALAAGRPDAAR